MVVEDEPPIRRDLCALLATMANVDVVAQASNGAEAMSLLDDASPDLLLTDIRMPVMGGLELIGAVRERHPRIEAAVITGYDEFAYAQTACRLHVCRYLLKPFDEVEIRDVVAGACAVVGEAREGALSRFLDFAQPHPDDGRFLAGLVGFVVQANVVFCGFAGRAIAAAAPASGIAGDSVEFARLIRSALSPDDAVFVLPCVGTSRARVIVASPSYNATKAAAFGARMSQLVGRSSGCFRTAVIGPYLSTLASAREQMRRIEDDAPRFVIPYRNTVVAVECIEAPEASASPSINGDVTPSVLQPVGSPDESYLSALCGTGQRESFLREMETTLRGAVERGVCQHTLEDCVRRFLGIALRSIAFVDDPDPIMAERAAIGSVRESSSINLALHTLAEQFSAIFRARVETPSTRDLVLGVDRYLREHYSEPVDGALLGRVFGRVPHYLSTVYKRYRHRSPTAELTRLRIERACEILTSDRPLPIRDVACAVGFSDQSYFCKVFRKATGMAPGEYRDRRAVW